MKKLAVITARGGSKRIPHKNIKNFCGRPILAYSIEAALQSGVFDTVMVSTDDEALRELRGRNDVKWTYVSPAADFQADGERSGGYILGGEELTLSSEGKSVVSYADFAIAMVDEAAEGGHIRQRISVVAK